MLFNVFGNRGKKNAETLILCLVKQRILQEFENTYGEPHQQEAAYLHRSEFSREMVLKQIFFSNV